MLTYADRVVTQAGFVEVSAQDAEEEVHAHRLGAVGKAVAALRRSLIEP
jgi:hypothetical protein